MKIRLCHGSGFGQKPKEQQGMAVIVVIALFAIMMLFLGSSLKSLHYLRQDLKLIEQHQLQRIHQAYARTNVAIVTNTLISLELGDLKR